jgi:hypothetical protein
MDITTYALAKKYTDSKVFKSQRVLSRKLERMETE